MPRLVTGTLGRMQRGHWNTTVANAWGVLALDRFAQRFEAAAVTGTTTAALGSERFAHAWHGPGTAPFGKTLRVAAGARGPRAARTTAPARRG